MSNVKRITSALLKDGKVASAIEVHRRFAGTPDIVRHVMEQAFRNREARDHAVELATRHTNALAIKDLIKTLVVAESNGQLSAMRMALNELDMRLGALGPDTPPRHLAKAVEYALSAFFVEHAERLVPHVDDVVTRQLFRRKLRSYKQLLRALQFDPDELPLARSALQRNRPIRTIRPTVVVRIPPTLWDNIESAFEDDVARPSNGLEHAVTLKRHGYPVRLAPQFSLPGPSFFAPFARSQAYPVVYVDRHKYSFSGPFIHVKKLHNGRTAIDRRGYSGWSEVETLPDMHDIESVPLGEARDFAERMRLHNFASAPKARPTYLDEYGRFGIVPLQMAADSVQRLSRFSIPDMVESAISFFGSRQLATVIRRHPKCKDREISAFLNGLSGRQGVHVSNHPTRDMIPFSEVVALCNSSMGWDAILAHKPLICFGKSEYSRIAYLINEISDLEEAPEFNEMFDPDMQDKLVYYYWHKHVPANNEQLTQTLLERVSEAFESLMPPTG